VSGSLKFRPLPAGRHRLRKGGRAVANQTMAFRAIVVVMSAAVAATVGLVMAPRQAAAPHASPSAVSRYHAAAPRLTSAEVYKLEHLNHAQAARLSHALDKALGSFGMRAGIGTGLAIQPGVKLAAFTWSVGADLTHAWVTASYANLWPYKRAINKVGAFADAVSSACGALDGYEIYGQAADEVCDAIGGTIAWLASRVNFPDTGSHGVYATFYWWPWGSGQSGYW
jgi:hypothetical protein